MYYQYEVRKDIDVFPLLTSDWSELVQSTERNALDPPILHQNSGLSSSSRTSS